MKKVLLIGLCMVLPLLVFSQLKRSLNVEIFEDASGNIYILDVERWNPNVQTRNYIYLPYAVKLSSSAFVVNVDTPPVVGLIIFDSTYQNMYVSTGTANRFQWRKINP